MPGDEPTDEPEIRRHDQRNRSADIAATVVLLFAHAVLVGLTLAVLGLLVMGTDPCGEVKCGDQAWIGRAIALGFWGGGVVFVGDVILAVVRLARRKVAFFVPIIGCVAQLALGVGAAAMESLAGPV